MSGFWIENNGPELASSTYWDSAHAHSGALVLSINAHAFRLLVPDGFDLPELGSSTRATISVGTWPEAAQPYAFEIRVEDGVRKPYVILLSGNQADRRPPPPIYPHTATFSVWGRGPRKLLELPATFRAVRTIPTGPLTGWVENVQIGAGERCAGEPERR